MYLKVFYLKIWIGLLISNYAFASSGVNRLCKPFEIHPHSSYPKHAPQLSSSELNALNVEELLAKIGQIPFHENFPNLFRQARTRGSLALTNNQVKSYLHCIHFYISQDTDKDGIPDWSAITNNQITNILIPLDPDINGNGTQNLFDPEPYQYHQITAPNPGREIPFHLRMADDNSASENSDSKVASRSELQEKLWHQHGIIAVDHSDQHSPVVLQELVNMLENSLNYFRQRPANSFLTLYAFRSHDAEEYMAAYHQEIRAISIGGRQAYPESEFSDRQKVHVLASLAHEIGHDFIFSHLNAHKLRDVSTRLGGWAFDADHRAESLYDPAFLVPHPDRENFKSEAKAQTQKLHTFSFTSQYSFTNIHEWFADAFAGWLLQSLGRKGLLGDNWQSLLLRTPNQRQAYWVNYQYISSTFTEWLDQKMSDIDSEKLSSNQ